MSQCLHSLISNTSFDDLCQKLFAVWGNCDSTFSFHLIYLVLKEESIPKKNRSKYNQHIGINLLRISYNHGNNFHDKIIVKKLFCSVHLNYRWCFSFSLRVCKMIKETGFYLAMILSLIPVNIYLNKINNRNTRKKLWNMFEANNKDTRTTLFALFWCL